MRPPLCHVCRLVGREAGPAARRSAAADVVVGLIALTFELAVLLVADGAYRWRKESSGDHGWMISARLLGSPIEHDTTVLQANCNSKRSKVLYEK